MSLREVAAAEPSKPNVILIMTDDQEYGVVFELNLPAGKTELRMWLYDETGKAGGAYVTEVAALLAFA